jgi:hypothetical protein
LNEELVQGSGQSFCRAFLIYSVVLEQELVGGGMRGSPEFDDQNLLPFDKVFMLSETFASSLHTI